MSTSAWVVFNRPGRPIQGLCFCIIRICTFGRSGYMCMHVHRYTCVCVYMLATKLTSFKESFPLRTVPVIIVP